MVLKKIGLLLVLIIITIVFSSGLYALKSDNEKKLKQLKEILGQRTGAYFNKYDGTPYFIGYSEENVQIRDEFQAREKADKVLRDLQPFFGYDLAEIDSVKNFSGGKHYEFVYYQTHFQDFTFAIPPGVNIKISDEGTSAHYFMLSDYKAPKPPYISKEKAIKRAKRYLQNAMLNDRYYKIDKKVVYENVTCDKYIYIFRDKNWEAREIKFTYRVVLIPGINLYVDIKTGKIVKDERPMSQL